jgi:hypothetical protein
MQRDEGVSTYFLGDKEKHQKFGHGVFRRQDTFGELIK